MHTHSRMPETRIIIINVYYLLQCSNTGMTEYNGNISCINSHAVKSSNKNTHRSAMIRSPPCLNPICGKHHQDCVRQCGQASGRRHKPRGRPGTLSKYWRGIEMLRVHRNESESHLPGIVDRVHPTAVRLEMLDGTGILEFA